MKRLGRKDYKTPNSLWILFIKKGAEAPKLQLTVITRAG